MKGESKMKRGSLKVYDVIFDNGNEILKIKQFAHSQGEVKKKFEDACLTTVKITKTTVNFSKDDLYDALQCLPEGGAEMYDEIVKICDIFKEVE